MESVNNFYKIINNKEETGQNEIYDELKSKEDKYYDSINRTIDLKQNEKEKAIYFQYTTIQEFIINLFLTLNVVIKELLEFNYTNINYDKLFKIFTKDHRLIYIGIIIIIIAFLILLIDFSDS